jgi:hypothetical protein
MVQKTEDRYGSLIATTQRPSPFRSVLKLGISTVVMRRMSKSPRNRHRRAARPVVRARRARYPAPDHAAAARAGLALALAAIEAAIDQVAQKRRPAGFVFLGALADFLR